MVIGETEILGQAKKAYAAARESGAAGPFLHRLFQRAFRVAKQVRTRTEITRGAVSVGSVAVDLAEQIFGNFETRKVLLLGAGEASERTARALVKRGVRDLRVATARSNARKRSPRSSAAGRWRWRSWKTHCREVDILISSTAARTPIVTRGKSRAAFARPTRSAAFHYRHRRAARRRSGCERDGRRFSLRHRFAAIDRATIARPTPAADCRRRGNHRRACGRFQRLVHFGAGRLCIRPG